MKMILNEYRLMPWQKEAQELIGQAHGGLLLRRRRGAATGIRARSRQNRSVVRIVRVASDNSDLPVDHEPQLRVRGAQRLFHGQRRRGAREDESQIAFPFRQRNQLSRPVSR